MCLLAFAPALQKWQPFERGGGSNCGAFRECGGAGGTGGERLREDISAEAFLNAACANSMARESYIFGR